MLFNMLNSVQNFVLQVDENAFLKIIVENYVEIV